MYENKFMYCLFLFLQVLFICSCSDNYSSAENVYDEMSSSIFKYSSVASSSSVTSSSSIASSSSATSSSSIASSSSATSSSSIASSSHSTSSSSIASSSSATSSSSICDGVKCKTWFVIGDSFSHGDFTGISPQPEIAEGRYAGKKPVYCYLIGNRTGWDVKDVSANGSTISFVDNHGFTKPNEGILYTTDFSAADIITIYYGINDSHKNVPIGDIDDIDPTTFYGAFNVTLKYLTENYPIAKIGIIISNGCGSEDYPDATEKIALKWGFPYLDIDGGINGITMIRSSNRNPASYEEKKKALLEQRVSETNSHPNEYAHELESYFIEEWLNTL